MVAMLFEMQNACKTFKGTSGIEVQALKEVSLTIAPGQFVLLTGASGSGKTTLLALLGALERPTKGCILFEGRNLGRQSDLELARIRRRIGFVFQNYSLIPGLPIWENVSYPLIPRGVSRRRRYDRAAELLSGLGLAEKFHARPAELSGGEQQRVAIARALVDQPSVLLMDEPTSNLDRMAGQALLELFQSYHARGSTVIVASHDDRIAGLATTIHELAAGQLKSASPNADLG